MQWENAYVARPAMRLCVRLRSTYEPRRKLMQKGDAALREDLATATRVLARYEMVGMAGRSSTKRPSIPSRTRSYDSR